MPHVPKHLTKAEISAKRAELKKQIKPPSEAQLKRLSVAFKQANVTDFEPEEFLYLRHWGIYTELPEKYEENLVGIAEYAQKLRDRMGFSLQIRNGYRPPIYNDSPVGAASTAPNSAHIRAAAIDIAVPSPNGTAENDRRLAVEAAKLWLTQDKALAGLGIYGGDQAHLDIYHKGGKRRRAWGKESKKKSVIAEAEAELEQEVDAANAAQDEIDNTTPGAPAPPPAPPGAPAPPPAPAPPSAAGSFSDCVDLQMTQNVGISFRDALELCKGEFPNDTTSESVQTEETKTCVESLLADNPGSDFLEALSICNDTIDIDDDEIPDLTPDWYKQEPGVLVSDIIIPEDYSISVLTTYSTQNLNDSVIEQAKKQAYYLSINVILRSYNLPILQELSLEKQLEIEQPFADEALLVEYVDYRVDAQTDSIYVLMLSTNLDEKMQGIFPEVKYGVSGGSQHVIKLNYPHSTTGPNNIGDRPTGTSIETERNLMAAEGFANFGKIFSSAADVMLEYDKNIKASGFTGGIDRVNLEDDARSVRNAGNIIISFLKKQPNFSPTTAYTISFKLDQYYEITSVEASSVLAEETFNKDIDYLNESLSDRDKFYIMNLSAIIDSNPVSTPWTDFLKLYVRHPHPDIYPAFKRLGREFEGEFVDALAAKYGGTIENVKSCATETAASFKDFASDIQGRVKEKSEKTLKESFKERKEQRSEDFTEWLTEQHSRQEDHIDDVLVRDIENTLKDIKNLDQVFGEVLNKISMGSLADALVACLPQIEITCQPLILPKVPTIGFAMMPTVDIMADLSDNIFSAIIEALTQLFVSVLSQMIEQLLDICNGTDDALQGVRETDSINELLDGTRPSTPGRETGRPSTKPYGTGDQASDVKLGILDSVCGITNSVAIGDLGPYLEELNKVFDDVSLLVSSRELCRLFTGKASQKTLSIIRTLLKTSYPLLFNCLKNKSSIASFFLKMGTEIDSDFCQTIADIDIDVSLIPGLIKCAPDEEPLSEEFSELSELYERKDIDPSTMRALLVKAKARKNKQMQNLRNTAKIISDNEKGKNPFNKMLNSINKDKNGAASPWFSYTHESYDFMQSELLDTMFDPIESNFAYDLKGVTDAMISNRDVDASIQKMISFIDENNNAQTPFVNPKLKNLESQGIDIDPILDADGETTVIRESKPEAAPSVKESLASLERSDTFNTVLDASGQYYQLRIDSDPAAIAGIGNFYENFSGLFGQFGTASNLTNPPPVLDAATIAAALPNWKIRYKVPYMSSTTQRIKDEYTIEIFSGQSKTAGSRELLKKEVSNELDPIIENFILSQLQNASEPLAISVNDKGKTKNFLAPATQNIFGKFVSQRWYQTMLSGISQENLSTAEISSFSKFNREMAKFSAASVFPQASKELFSLIAAQITDSVLFDSRVASFGVGGITQTTYSPYLSDVNFRREQTPMELACGIYPDPLKVSCFKKEAADNIAKNSDEISAPPLPSPGTTALSFGSRTSTLPVGPDPWDKQVLKSVVKMTIRAYAFDFAVKGIFLIPIFRIEDATDSYLVEFGVEKMLSEMQEYQGFQTNYLSNFRYWAYITYIDDIGGEPLERRDVTRKLEDEALNYLFSKSFESVVPGVRDNIERSIPDVVAISKSPKEYLVENWLPLIDIPHSDERPRFVDASEGGILSIDKTGTTKIGDTTVKLENGNFFLEKFYKVIRRTDAEITSNLLTADATSPQSSEDALNSTNVKKLVDKFNDAWEQNFTNVPGERIQYINVDEFQESYNKFADSISQALYKICPGFAFNGEYIPQNDCVRPLILSDFFEEIAPGMRMIYLLPIQNGAQSTNFKLFQQNVDSKFGTTIPSYQEYYGGNTYFSDAMKSLSLQQGSNTKLSVPMSNVRQREKAYSILEKKEVPSVGTVAEVAREIYPIPLIDTTVCVGDSLWWEANKDNSITPYTNNSAWSIVYNAEDFSLKQELILTDEYKVLFDYVFPLDRYLAILQVYTILDVSGLPNVDSSFGGTKYELYSLFNVLALSSNTTNDRRAYKFRGIKTSHEISQAMDGLKVGVESPCFSASIGLPGFKGLGLEAILKLALKTPILIYKGFVEIYDPNIKLAKFISELLKAIGICVPIPFVSFALLPPTVFGFPPLGIGIGPPLTPFGFGYLGLGFFQESDCCFYNHPFPSDLPSSSTLAPGCDSSCDEKTY